MSAIKVKLVVFLSVVFTILFLLQKPLIAMHIMEGFLQPRWAIAWGVACVPFLVVGFITLKKKVTISSKKLILFALSGAYAFVLSALKMPSVTGSCSHPTGMGLGAILFGPFLMSIIGVIVLLFQAILLAHGGLTTLGANTFSMGIIGPLFSFGIYKLFRKLKINISISVFIAALIGNLMTYVTTSLQLALAYPGEKFTQTFSKFLGIFAVTQVPLATIEGILTVVIFGILKKYSEAEFLDLKVI